MIYGNFFEENVEEKAVVNKMDNVGYFFPATLLSFGCRVVSDDMMMMRMMSGKLRKKTVFHAPRSIHYCTFIQVQVKLSSKNKEREIQVDLDITWHIEPGKVSRDSVYLAKERK